MGDWVGNVFKQLKIPVGVALVLAGFTLALGFMWGRITTVEGHFLSVENRIGQLEGRADDIDMMQGEVREVVLKVTGMDAIMGFLMPRQENEGANP